MGKDNLDLSGISDDDLAEELKRRGSYPLTRFGKKKK